jgi:hypothetical protein
MVDGLDEVNVLDSAQRPTSPRSQHSAPRRQTKAIAFQLSKYEVPCIVNEIRRPLPRVNPRVRAAMFAFLGRLVLWLGSTSFSARPGQSPCSSCLSPAPSLRRRWRWSLHFGRHVYRRRDAGFEFRGTTNCARWQDLQASVAPRVAQCARPFGRRGCLLHAKLCVTAIARLIS